MKPATAPRSARALRVLVVDGASGAMRVVSGGEIATLFEPKDLVVVNDAATLPASLAGRTARGEELELRLLGETGDRRWTAALFGSGDWRTPTEKRPAPPRVVEGDLLVLGGALRARVLGFRPESARLIELAFELVDRSDAPLADVWAELYRVGGPVQYAHVPEPLALWDVQNVYAGRPWAVEMPSAGRVLGAEALLALHRRGVAIARVTHAAGLSSIGDAALDALLPLPERYEVSEETWEAIARTRKANGRVVAIGTSVTRALEGGARAGTRVGVTDLRIGRGTRRAVVDAVLSGVHEADTSHYALLGAFASEELLSRALARAEEEGLLGHEMGDACLVWGEPRENLPEGRRRAPRDASRRMDRSRTT
ncbi:MAG: S-adenosylmethionine:tRNA ribosyltransferase-isomerase [Labilithrix sp.]|nr:S-adenosylmethionine:tRNA ribosyltransferase-isomerase [Labilithrix sp.]